MSVDAELQVKEIKAQPNYWSWAWVRKDGHRVAFGYHKNEEGARTAGFAWANRAAKAPIDLV